MENNADRLGREFLAAFEYVADECQRLCHITRARELQVEALKQACGFVEKVVELKNDAIARADEECANILLSFEMLVTSLAAQLQMWIALKDEEPSEAWNHLVHAQMTAQDSMLAHEMGSRLNTGRYIERLLVLEKFLFPPQMFASIGGTIKYAQCSICNKEYGTCDHLVGRPYMGQLCHRVIIQFELEEVSVVEKPANKRCRWTAITDAQGVLRDTMTWHEVSGRDRGSLEKPSKEQVLEYFNQSDDL